MQQAGQRFGGVDVPVNNAGYGYRAAVEEGDDAEVAGCSPPTCSQRWPRSRRCCPGCAPGAAAAWATCPPSPAASRRRVRATTRHPSSRWKGLSHALRKEVGPLGIKMMVVGPGAFRTEFAGCSLHQVAANIADYADTAGPRRKENDKTHDTQPGDPARAAQQLVDTVQSGKMPFRFLLGSDAVHIVSAEMDEQRREFEAWKAISASTDF